MWWLAQSPNHHICGFLSGPKAFSSLLAADRPDPAPRSPPAGMLPGEPWDRVREAASPRRIAELASGEISAAVVCRLTSFLSRSSGLVEQTRVHSSLGNAVRPGCRLRLPRGVRPPLAGEASHLHLHRGPPARTGGECRLRHISQLNPCRLAMRSSEDRTRCRLRSTQTNLPVRRPVPATPQLARLPLRSCRLESEVPYLSPATIRRGKDMPKLDATCARVGTSPGQGSAPSAIPPPGCPPAVRRDFALPAGPLPVRAARASGRPRTSAEKGNP
jgi:hypothetical protein